MDQFRKEPCPYCGTDTEADWVDIGVGYTQSGPFHCLGCRSSEIGAFDDKTRVLTADEKRTGWYAPQSEPGSSANVIGGEIVSTHVMKDAYRAAFVNNPAHGQPGVVEAWHHAIRKPVPETMQSSYVNKVSPRAVAVLDLHEVTKGAWMITHISVPTKFRGQGLATQLLKQALDDADRLGVKLSLWANGSSDDGLHTAQVIAWYKRHGFVRGMHATHLIREPHK